MGNRSVNRIEVSVMAPLDKKYFTLIKVMNIQKGQKIYYKVRPPYYKLSSEEGYWIAAIVQKVNPKTLDITYKDHLGGGDETVPNHEANLSKVRLASITTNRPTSYDTEVRDYYPEVN